MSLWHARRAGLDALAITDPHQAVAIDVAALNANPNLPGSVANDQVTNRSSG